MRTRWGIQTNGETQSINQAAGLGDERSRLILGACIQNSNIFIVMDENTGTKGSRGSTSVPVLLSLHSQDIVTSEMNALTQLVYLHVDSQPTNGWMLVVVVTTMIRT